jgi:hypothetical protein
MRGIQYAAASRLYHWRLGILDRPLSRAMTAESVARDDRMIRSLRAQRRFHKTTESKGGLLRFARNDGTPNFGYDFQFRIRLRGLAARCTRVLQETFRPQTGRGECRMPNAPAASCAMIVVERTRATTSTPESPGIPARNGFTTYFELSPVTGLFCHRRPRIGFV